MRYQTVALIGGTGFIGRHLVPRLLAAGRHVRVAARRRSHAGALQMLPVSITECDVHDPAQLADFLDGADVVINLVGVLQDRRQQPYGPAFKNAHVDLPGKIVEACTQLGIRRFLHVSALAADSNGPSMYLRSKGDGEKRIEAGALPPVNLLTTIFRPSVIFGPGDKFLNTFAALQKIFPFVPLACANAKFQPVFVGDVADAIANAIDTDATIGRTFELGGPRVYTLGELVRLAGAVSGHSRPVFGLPDWIARLQGAVFEHLPNAPITRDNIDSMTIDSVTSAPIDPVLRVTPVAIESIAPGYLGEQSARQRASDVGSVRAAAPMRNDEDRDGRG